MEEHLKHNLKILSEAYGGRSLMPVIKAQAYGHGLCEMAKLLESIAEPEKLPYFCVARLCEAQSLRHSGVVRRILVLSAYDLSSLKTELPDDVDLCINSSADLKALLQSLSKNKIQKFGVHLNFDTGMHRLGIVPQRVFDQDFLEDLAELCRLGVKIEGLMTHLACSESEVDVFSGKQMKLFGEIQSHLKAQWQSEWGAFPQWIHVANSEGTTKGIGLSEGATACRVGLHLLGAFATDIERSASPLGNKLKPVLRVEVPLKRLHALAMGDGVGYMQIYRARQASVLVGTFAFGYADGLPREFSRSEQAPWNIGLVIEGVRVPFAGVVSMDLCGVDLTHHPKAEVWRKALEEKQLPEIWAEWIGVHQRSEEIAGAVGTISYEIFCRLSSRLERVVIPKGGF